jgi:hypothetical protein
MHIIRDPGITDKRSCKRPGSVKMHSGKDPGSIRAPFQKSSYLHHHVVLQAGGCLRFGGHEVDSSQRRMEIITPPPSSPLPPLHRIRWRLLMLRWPPLGCRYPRASFWSRRSQTEPLEVRFEPLGFKGPSGVSSGPGQGINNRRKMCRRGQMI